MACAQLYLCPGLVGLGILDAFAVGLPLVTTNVAYHSHEVAYLAEGRNGVMVDMWKSPEAYADAVALLLTNEVQLAKLQAGSRSTAEGLTVESMAERFADGVMMALAAGKRGRGAPSEGTH